MVEVTSLAPAPPHGAPDSSGWLGAPEGRSHRLGCSSLPQPPPRVLELAASKAAHSTAFDHPGLALQWAGGAMGFALIGLANLLSFSLEARYLVITPDPTCSLSASRRYSSTLTLTLSLTLT